jgi:hypothetical protein
MAKAASWNVEHFKEGLTRVNRVVVFVGRAESRHPAALRSRKQRSVCRRYGEISRLHISDHITLTASSARSC